MKHLLLTIDYSTNSTGYAIFDIQARKPLEWGFIVPKIKKVARLYPDASLLKMKDVARQIVEIVEKIHPAVILIEEVNRGISRIGQKTLSGGHFILLDQLIDYLHIIKFKDSDGATGWRKQLKLILSDQDKVINKDIRDFNKKVKKKDQKVLITKKHLACRYVNDVLKMNFDVDANPHDNDIVDALGIGLSYLEETK